MEIPAREMEVSSMNPNHCANFNIDGGISPVVVGDQCVVQLVSIPRKVFDQLRDDTAPIRDIVQEIQMSTGAVIKAVDRETTRSAPGQQFGQQKARKEYYFQVAGSAAQVERAKDEIDRVFKNCQADGRVSLKMDVSFSDHSFIIGRFGRGIQNVSHETNCLIHFPDSNKNKQYEKSNQVSISGPPEGVLEARRRIRKLLPISFAFVIADAHHNTAMWQVGPQAFETRPRVQEMINILQNEHRITITMLPMHSLQSSAALVTVRGRHANIDRIKDGILKLMAFLVPDNPQLSVYVGIEVSPHHLDFVTGPSGIKLFELMRETNTTIEIPNIPDRRQSIPTVRIVGQVLNVYEAWVKFMDLLPLALLVEIPADANPYHEFATPPIESAWSSGEEIPTTHAEDSSIAMSSAGASRIDEIAHILNEHLEPYDITLISRQKSREIRETTRQWWLVIKGPEKYVDIMFEIHKSLSKDDPVTHVLTFLQHVPEPVRYPRFNLRPISRMGAPSSSSNVDLSFRPGATSLTNSWGTPSAPPSTALRQRALALAYPQDESPASMTSTPIKFGRQQNSDAEPNTGSNLYWKNSSDTLQASFLSALEESMATMRLNASRSQASGCAERDSFTLNDTGSSSGYSAFRAPAPQAAPIFAPSGMSARDQASCSGVPSHSLFEDDILRNCLNDLPLTSNVGSDLGSCASNSASFEPSGFGNPFTSPSDAYFGNPKRSLYKDPPHHSLLSSFGTESDLTSRSITKSTSLELDSASPMHSNLGASDSGYSGLKEGFGDLDFECPFPKTAANRSNEVSRYNLWGQDSTRGRTFDAAPGSGRETHS